MIKPKLREVNLIDTSEMWTWCTRIFRHYEDQTIKIEIGYNSRWLTYDFDSEKQRIIEWLNEN